MQKQRKTSNTTTSEIVLESLREQIINGILQPQEKLVEAEIARKFGLSRGPVREALRQLAVVGLVDYCPNKGCTVALLSPQDAYEVFFLRGSLEKLAIQKSNCLLSDYSLMIMEASIEEFRKAILEGNTMKAVRADETFHLQIIRSAQLNRLTKMWELLSPLNGAMFLSVQNANRFGQLSGDAVSFFLPSSPSFCISSSFGIAIVRSWMIMEDVIYGVILNAKMDIVSNEPPVKALKKLNESPVWFAKKF